MAESRMNLAALQQRDPFITAIIDTASQVALYKFSSETMDWERTSIEGTLFIYRRTAAPLYGFMILNRLGLQNLIEPFTKTLEFQVQEPFLLYRNAANIYGIWFYERKECSRLGTLMNKTAQSVSSTSTPGLDMMKSVGVQPIQKSPIHQSQINMVPVNPDAGVDIMKILTKAQHEYDQSKSVTSVPKASEPKSMTDNLRGEILTREQPLIRPTPVKYDSHHNSRSSPELNQQVDNPMSIEALFRKASISQHRAELPDVTKPSALQKSGLQSETEGKQDLHPLLMQLINKTPTVEQIENVQHVNHEGDEDLVFSPTSNTGVLLKPEEMSVRQLPIFTHSVVEVDKEAHGSVSCPDVLLSPMSFTKTANPSSHPSSSASLNISSSDQVSSDSCELEESSLPIAALTKQQLQQAFIYLLKTDVDFMSKLHEAYHKSLQELTKKT